MFRVGQIIKYIEMSVHENAHLQKGMNFRMRGEKTIILMSTRPNAPYNDETLDEGRAIIYEGHDIPRQSGVRDPKLYDQQLETPNDNLTENGKFFESVRQYKAGESLPEKVTVYEKVRDGIWVYNGIFLLTDAWMQEHDGRMVCKFRLEIADDQEATEEREPPGHNRMIPSHVKQEVWKRDGGKCVMCGDTENLHFDHIIPYSKGGSSLTADNIQLLCAKHNLHKHDRIE